MKFLFISLSLSLLLPRAFPFLFLSREGNFRREERLVSLFFLFSLPVSFSRTHEEFSCSLFLLLLIRSSLLPLCFSSFSSLSPFFLPSAVFSPLLSRTRACIIGGGGDFSSLSFSFLHLLSLAFSLSFSLSGNSSLLPLSSLLATEIISVARGVFFSLLSLLSLLLLPRSFSPLLLPFSLSLARAGMHARSLSRRKLFSSREEPLVPSLPLPLLPLSLARGQARGGGGNLASSTSSALFSSCGPARETFSLHLPISFFREEREEREERRERERWENWGHLT